MTSSSGNFFNITSVELKASSNSNHTIFLQVVTNPAAGGTGSFKIETRRGNLNILDFNHNFETVGIVGDPQTIASFSFTRTKNSVNDVSDYTLSLHTITLLPKNGSVIISIGGDFAFTSTSTCSTSVSAQATCNYLSSQIVVFSVLYNIFLKYFLKILRTSNLTALQALIPSL